MILRDVEGPESLALSQPFSAEDLGDAWHVRANPDAIGSDGVTPWEIIIQKIDAKVIALGRARIVKITKGMLRPPGPSDESH